MHHSYCWLALSLSLSSMASAQNPVDSTFKNALSAVRFPLLLAHDSYSGAGAKVLDDAVDQAKFVLVGEDHITREIPQFVEALCDEMHPDAYAVEAGPLAASYVDSLLHDSHRVAFMTARDQQYPDNMAFLNIREENDLAAHCAESSRNPQFALWGLDQEFLGAAGVLLAQMAATQPGPKSQASIVAAQAEERADAIQALRSGSFGDLFLLSLKSRPAITALNAAVALDGKPKTRLIDKELSDSWEVYTHHESANPGASYEKRAEILKQHFLTAYRPFHDQYKDGRVLLKLGDNHTGKGLNETHDLDLGDFVAELAAAEQTRSLHILVLGLRGMHYTMPAYGRPMSQEAFVMANTDPYYSWMGGITDDILSQPAGTPGLMLTLFDLRRLRYQHLQLPAEWEHVIYSNDLLVVFPKLSVASEMR
jgi:hypothetical protein